MPSRNAEITSQGAEHAENKENTVSRHPSAPSAFLRASAFCSPPAEAEVPSRTR